MAMEDTSPWYGGLLGSQYDGLDANQKQQAVSQGLLALGSGLLKNQYYDPRTGQGGLAAGLAEGGQGMAAAPQQARMQAYQNVMTQAKLGELQRQQKQQAAVDKWMESNRGNLGSYGITPGTEGLYSSDQLAKMMAERAGKRLEMKDKIELEPQLEAAKYAAVTPHTLQRKAGESDIDFDNRVRTERALTPIMAGRAGAETAARESAGLPYVGQKALLQARGSALGGYSADLTPSGIAGPDGRVMTNAEAKANAGNKSTAEQSKAANFSHRMLTVEPILQKFATAQIPSGKEVLLRGVGADTLANSVMTKERQQYVQAQEDWVRAKLRLESGASIGAKEMTDEVKTYFPQYGDKSEVIAQKAQRRALATQGLIEESNGAFARMFGRAKTETAPSSAGLPALPDGFIIPGG